MPGKYAIKSHLTGNPRRVLEKIFSKNLKKQAQKLRNMYGDFILSNQLRIANNYLQGNQGVN